MGQLNIKYKDKHKTAFGCVLDKMISGEPIALKVVNKINGKLRFLYRKIVF